MRKELHPLFQPGKGSDAPASRAGGFRDCLVSIYWSDRAPAGILGPMDTMEDQRMERSDFLRLFGLGAGLAGLGSISTAQSATQAGQGRYLFIVSHGSDDPNRAVLALLLASVAAKKGPGSVQVWMTLGGAEVAHRAKVDALRSPIFESMGSASSLLAELVAKGVTLKVCPPCAAAAGARGADRHPAVEEAGGDWLLANLPGAEVVWL